MSRPTWEQMQAAQAESDRLVALRPIEQMCHRFGEVPRGTTCGTCVHLVDKADYLHIRPHRYYKCGFWAETFHPNAPFPLRLRRRLGLAGVLAGLRTPRAVPWGR